MSKVTKGENNGSRVRARESIHVPKETKGGGAHDSHVKLEAFFENSPIIARTLDSAPNTLALSTLAYSPAKFSPFPSTSGKKRGETERGEDGEGKKGDTGKKSKGWDW